MMWHNWDMPATHQKEKRVTGYKLQFRIKQGDVLQNRINFKPIFKDIPIPLLLYKINLNNTLIVLAGKPFNRTSLANLSGTFNNKWFTVWIVLPFQQVVVYLSLSSLSIFLFICYMCKDNTFHIIRTINAPVFHIIRT